jgi:Protein of unknown function (DUF1570)
MSCGSWLAALCLLLQVPVPTAEAEAAHQLEADRRTIVTREAAELSALAAELARGGKTQEAEEVRAKLPRPVRPDGPTRFLPLPEVVGPQKGFGPPGAREIQGRAAAALFELAGRAAGADSPQYALASVCLRAVLEREPDHKEARRLLGYVPHDGGWATPFAVGQLKKKSVNHPTFGWVPADWVPHLDRGELPAPPSKGRNKTRWLPVAEADRLRADWSPPWLFATEHFEIQTNVTLAEAITFGRRLEAFHDLFMTLFADILGENIPLIRRFKDPKLNGDGHAVSKLHQVYYFGSKAEFVAHLSPKLGPEVALNLGFYDPPKSGRGRVPAYFYRDPDGQIPETATLYHEVSHQLLFETAGPNAYTKNAGNIWVFEGLGAYFETVMPQPDGSLEVGGLVGPRIDEAFNSLVIRRGMIPMAEFVAFDEATFRDKVQIYHNYQQAIAMAVFFMQWNQGAYRDAFLDYVQDAYHGRIKRGVGRSLRDRLRQPYSTLEKQFLTFLKEGKGPPHGSDPAEAKPGSGGAIRTVPGG